MQKSSPVFFKSTEKCMKKEERLDLNKYIKKANESIKKSSPKGFKKMIRFVTKN